MRKISGRWVWIWTVVALGLVGCGKSQRESVKKEEGGAQTVEESAPFGLGIVGAVSARGPGKEIPGEKEYQDASSHGAYGQARVQGREVTFLKTIPLAGKNAGPRDAFLVWGGEIPGSAALSVQVDHQIQGAEREIVSEGSSVSASYHPDSHRWFIPLRALLPKAAGRSDPDDLHILNIEQTLDTGSRTLLQVRLKLDGGMPLIRPEKIVQSGGPEVGSEGWLRQISSAQGWTARSEAYTNPTNRMLTLWVHAGASVLHLQTGIRFGWDWSPFRIFPNLASLPPDWEIQWQVMESKLQLTGLRVEEGEKSREYSLNESEWMRFELKPKAMIRIHWIARQIQADFPCQVPQGRIRKVCAFQVPFEETSRTIATPACDTSATPWTRTLMDVPERVQVAAFRMAGVLQRDVELTESADSELKAPQAGQPLLGSIRGEEGERLEMTFNQPPEGPFQALACSGLSF